jgi:hypothetical protein
MGRKDAGMAAKAMSRNNKKSSFFFFVSVAKLEKLTMDN